LKPYLSLVALFGLVILPTFTFGQTPNPITTALSFLTISPDARSGGMGDGGVSYSSDANTLYWNPSRIVFLEHEQNISLSYSPYYAKTVKGSFLGYVSYVSQLANNFAIGFSLRNLKLGENKLYDENETFLGNYRPNELSLDGTMARKFGWFSLGLTLRYIHSDIATVATQNMQAKPINSISTDVSMSFVRKYEWATPMWYSFGLNISNIGPKVSYSPGQKYFLPTNLRLGSSLKFVGKDYQFTVGVDINKLLVPTPPIRDPDGYIIKGKDDYRSVVSGIFGSFSDAPGGSQEELKEIYGSIGMELIFAKLIAIRGGYFYENADKGNRNYATAGVGLTTTPLDINLAYIIAPQKESPLANTVRVSLIIHFVDKKDD
jgi:hypothetical protein